MLNFKKLFSWAKRTPPAIPSLPAPSPPAPAPSPPAPVYVRSSDPFVAVIVEGVDHFLGTPIYLGRSEVIKGNGQVILIAPQVEMEKCRVIVFGDLRRIRVMGIFAGNMCYYGCYGDCPTAYIPKLHIGENLRIDVTVIPE